ncbi:MAG: TetR/AcrR family transcriptional regulator [Ilumatobacter sp.]
MADAPPQGVRARARAQLLDDVGRVARAHLAESGAAALSVRAIARDLGLAPSALYRYYPSRDALLTRLIIDSYDSLGAAMEVAEGEVDRDDVAERFRTIARSLRAWATANPHEYALIYGSPVPGYEAPSDTIDPALRTSRTLIRLAADIEPTPAVLRSLAGRSPALDAQLRAANAVSGVDADLDVLAVGVGIWSQLFGMVSFELFGTFTNAFDPADDLFEHQVDLALTALGLDPRT